MILIEPEESYVRRSESRVSHGINTLSPSGGSETLSRELHGLLRYMDGWDEHIIAYTSSRAEPIRIVSLASQLRRCVRHRDKQHKEEIKRQILLRVGALIRTGSLVRVRRKYVTVPRPVMRSSPL